MSALAPGVLDALVDARTGLVRGLSPVPVPDHLPPSFVQVASRLSDSRQFVPWASDSAGAGYAFDDQPSAVAAAIGEAVERWCGNLVPDHLEVASHAELTASGREALDPTTLALFSAEQYAEPGFPWEPFTREVRTLWTTGTRSGRELLVPACVVWPSYALTTRRPLSPVLQAGLATGPTRQAAERSALLEVVERDAMALAWHGRRGLLELVVDDELACLAGEALDVRWLAFTSEHEVPVVGALVHDPTTGYLALGTGCRADPRDAAVKALGEGLQLSLLLAEYDDPQGAFAAAATRPGSPLRAWRADRAYARDYAEDLSDVRDYGCHLQLSLDPAVQQRFLDELSDAVVGTVPLASLPQGDVEALTARLDPVAVDVTTDDVRCAGLHVSRVLVPGLLCNSAAGFPLLGGERMLAALAGRPRRALPLPH